jgi:hypothetical protein
MNQGQAYGNARKVEVVNILCFAFGQGANYLYRGFFHFRGIHPNDKLLLSKAQRIKFGRTEAGLLYPEYFILEINKFDTIASDKPDNWINHLKTSELPAE